MARFKEFIILMVQTVILVVITLFCLAPISCKLTEEGIHFVSGDYVAPAIETVEVIDEKTVQMNFSEGIKISSVVVSKMVEEISDSMEHSGTESLSPAIAAAGGEFGTVGVATSVSEDGTAVTFLMEEECEIGQAYEIYGAVEDKTGNTLSFCVPFTGYNSHLPKVLMTELLVKYGTGTIKKETVYRCEFVELLALTDGNLAGLEIVSGSDGEKKKYQIPPVEVKAGEVIVVHLRSVGEGCITETDNLNESTAQHSAKNCRDIWSSNESACLNDKTDVVILRNGPDGAIMDAFMYAEDGAEAWKKSCLSFAEDAAACGIYASSDISEACSSKGLSPLQSFQRKDAASLKNAALAGTLEEYPVTNNLEFWEISSAKPGAL